MLKIISLLNWLGAVTAGDAAPASAQVGGRTGQVQVPVPSGGNSCGGAAEGKGTRGGHASCLVNPGIAERPLFLSNFKIKSTVFHKSVGN